MTAEIADSYRFGVRADASREHATASTLHAPEGAAREDVARMVMAVGALLEWQGAFLLDLSSRLARPTVAQLWAGSGAERPVTEAGLIWQLHNETWERRICWRPANRRDPEPCAFVAVPVRVYDEVRGALCFFGPQLQLPDEVSTGLLEAIAGILATDLAAREQGQDGASRRDTLERAIAMVDVFAYTVRVNPDGTMPWRYFGPNSDAIFGSGLFPDEPLTTVLDRHAHPEDAELVRELGDALVSARPLDIELRVLGLDGVTRWVSWRTAPRIAEGVVYVDGVATDVSSRRSLESLRGEVASDNDGSELLREHARVVRDANDNVLQRIFAAGLRLQILKRKLSDAEAHAVTAIAFQLDQAATDLREVVIDLSRLADSAA